MWRVHFHPTGASALGLVVMLSACTDHRAPLAPGDLLLDAPTLSHAAAAPHVLRVPEDFSTIQAAVDAAGPGDIVQVAAGTYNENVVITTSGLRLRGTAGSAVDGTGLTGIGIHVLGSTGSPTTGVEIMGFEVRNFERGVVLENVEHSQVHLNEVHNNGDKVPDALFLSEGIVLINADFNAVTNNSTHDNGHDGIQLTRGSSGNLIHANRTRDNGWQTLPTPKVGCGINVAGVGAANNDNHIVENEVLDNHWGILLTGAVASSGNRIAQNRVHGHARAGIAILGPSNGNFVLQNNATGNGLNDPPLGPSTTFDLFDLPPVNNTWERNQGRSNF
jgi:parallel beta-helix repeat protein